MGSQDSRSEPASPLDSTLHSVVSEILSSLTSTEAQPQTISRVVPPQSGDAPEQAPDATVVKPNDISPDADGLEVKPTFCSDTSSDDGSTGAVLGPSVERKRKLLFFAMGVVLACGVLVGVGLVYHYRKERLATEAPSSQPTTAPSARPSSAPSVSPSAAPSSAPSLSPSSIPTASPSNKPTSSPSSQPTDKPSSSPTKSPAPSAKPTGIPSASPTVSPAPTLSPSSAPSESPTISAQPTLNLATFFPGNLTTMENGLLLSEGLRATIIASTGKPVQYLKGESEAKFHGFPDYGATFADERKNNKGGWVYTSNSEMPEKGTGGVGAITFDKDGNVLDYKMVLENTTMNCGGGRTPWNTFVSCEEIEFHGEIYQVDPFGERQAQKMTMGSEKGRWESFAYDIRDENNPKFFATEDHNKGTVRRFSPEVLDWENPWTMLGSPGVVDYLFVRPNKERTGGTFEWTNDRAGARANAKQFYPQSEGIDIYKNEMFVVCKNIKQMFTFDLDKMTYYNQTTESGLFDGGPDQMQRILDHDGDLLFFTEEGGKDAGIHARDEKGLFFTILESPVYEDETTGLAFSPDAKHMYVAYQVNGLLFDITREDGLPFSGRTLNVKYHQAAFG